MKIFVRHLYDRIMFEMTLCISSIFNSIEIVDSQQSGSNLRSTKLYQIHGHNACLSLVYTLVIIIHDYPTAMTNCDAGKGHTVYYVKLLNNANQGMDHGQRLLCINLEAEGLFTY